MNTEAIKALQDKWQAKVQNDVFEIDRIEATYISGHHPFTVGPKHIEHASKHCSGMLGQATLDAIPCAAVGCRRMHADPVHNSEVACFLKMKRECTQKEATSILMPIKAEIEADGISGFAFLNHRLITDWGKVPQ